MLLYSFVFRYFKPMWPLLVLGFLGCGTDSGTRTISSRLLHDDIIADFLYLPQNDKTSVILRADSVFIKRTNSRDSVVRLIRHRIVPAQYPVFDSLLYLVNTLTYGQFVTRGVFDGTKLWITFRGNTLFCDNCLNDYVLAAGGRPLPWQERNIVRIKDAVTCLNSLVAAAEEPFRPRRNKVEVFADLKQTREKDSRYKITVDGAKK